jgi:uncharacterized membrane protein
MSRNHERYGSMRRTAIRRLAVLVVFVAALAAVALVAYALGTGHTSGFFGMRGMGFRSDGMGWSFGPGNGILGLLCFVLVGVLVVWLVAAVVSPGSGWSGPARPAGPAPADVERLRELSEMHTRGELTDDEFTAAKRKLLGMQ